MADVKIRIVSNKRPIGVKIQNGSVAAVEAVAEELLGLVDVPVDQGTLKASAQTASNFKKGLLVWATEYAQKQWFTHKTKKLWAVTAAKKYRNELLKVAQNAFEKGFGP